MRIIPFIIAAAATAGLVVVLNSKLGTIPPLGALLSPSHGLWKNAEPVQSTFSLTLKSTTLQHPVEVYLDERLVPHVFAESDEDAFFAQGYLHAKFRLWQMEFQTYAAAGRLCEIIGEKVGQNSVLEKHDRLFRRLGMVYAAENAVKEMRKDSLTSKGVDAYTAGINYYIQSLRKDQYPIEYKLLDYAPEPWTPLKTALFLKYMSYDLARDMDDFEYTNLLQHIGADMFEKAFPIMPDSLDPIAPRGTQFAQPNIALPLPPIANNVSLSAVSLHNKEGFAFRLEQKHPDVGSNNWVVSGIKTQSGRPILCNDPHLGLNLPSLWYEIQLHTPKYNVYGVSFPGAPGVIIGFNDSIAWGVTNAMRDVMDFYEVTFRDSTMAEYQYNGQWLKTEWRTETIGIRGSADFSERIPMTIWGPVLFDQTYQSNQQHGKAYAVRWSAHDPSKEALTFLLLNRAKNYTDYKEAISHFSCPGQNFVFASKSNEIAWWQQADFPAKWRRQGDFVMPGNDSSYRWQSKVPIGENIHLINPSRGFVSSANQLPADTSYPYYLGGVHDVYRGIIINRYLSSKQNIVPADMQKMQNDNYNVFAEMALPMLLKYVQLKDLSKDATGLLQLVKTWNKRADAQEKGMTVFFEWWKIFADKVWLDNITRPDALPVPHPADFALLEGILKDSSFPFIDDINTPNLETAEQLVTASLQEAAKKFEGNTPAWAEYKATGVRHLLTSLVPFSRLNLPIGGGSKIINAATGNWGPSWRVVVQMTDKTEAYGVYPGGQSGNPGSKYYDQFINQWVKGEYNKLWIMQPEEKTNAAAKWLIQFNKQ